MDLFELVVIRGIRDRREMKNGVELLITELLAPIELCQILSHEIAAVTGEIFKVTGSKVVNHSQTRVRKFFLQGKREIRADEAGTASNNEIRRRAQFRKRIGRDR